MCSNKLVEMGSPLFDLITQIGNIICILIAEANEIFQYCGTAVNKTPHTKYLISNFYINLRSTN